MESVLIVDVRAPVASFRRPLDHNYQRSLLLPPPTTLIGIAAAALGLSDFQLWAPDSPLRSLRTAVWIHNEPGRARDLWTLLKIKSNKMLRSPYLRELLFFVQYTLFYGGPESLLAQLYRAFQDPAYPLSLGREDELLLIDSLQLQTVAPGDPIFFGTIIPGDFRQQPFRPILEPGIQMEAPSVEVLPKRFSIDQKNYRNPEHLQPFSFLPLHYKIHIANMPALQWQNRSFTWLN